jgi:hypothetical protein
MSAAAQAARGHGNATPAGDPRLQRASSCAGVRICDLAPGDGDGVLGSRSMPAGLPEISGHRHAPASPPVCVWKTSGRRGSLPKASAARWTCVRPEVSAPPRSAARGARPCLTHAPGEARRIGDRRASQCPTRALTSGEATWLPNSLGSNDGALRPPLVGWWASPTHPRGCGEISPSVLGSMARPRTVRPVRDPRAECPAARAAGGARPIPKPAEAPRPSAGFAMAGCRHHETPACTCVPIASGENHEALVRGSCVSGASPVHTWRGRRLAGTHLDHAAGRPGSTEATRS